MRGTSSTTGHDAPPVPAPTPPGQRAAVYLDLDGTILATSTLLALGTPMRRSGIISTASLARGIIAQLPAQLMGYDERQADHLMEQLARLSVGVDSAHLRSVVVEALGSAIEPAVYTEVLDLIEAHRRAGHDVVIVSGSLQEMVDPVARLVGADRALGTRLEVDEDGYFTGRVSRPMVHEAKTRALEADAAAHGISLAASWAYSDSVSDLPMLQTVGHPVAVNPDKALRRLAAQQDWPVRDFRRPVTLRRPLVLPPGVEVPGPLARLLPRALDARRREQVAPLAEAALVLGVGAAVAVAAARR